LRGADGTAGEIGHICVEPFGAPCGCGSRGCVEQYSSATAIVRITRELENQYPRSILRNKASCTSLDVYEAGQTGDELALEVFRRMGFYLGVALADLVNVLNPDAIVIGGGAAAGWDLFVDHVREQIDARAFREPALRAKLIRAALGDDAGILGAARSGFDQISVFD
jgi:glucokinase